jgi:hypothetical protein
LKKAIIAVGVCAVLGVVLYLTKPGGTGSAPPVGDADAGPPERIVTWSPGADAGPDGGAASAAATAPAKRPGQRRMHGSADVVRSGDADEEPYRAVVRPRFPPDWKNPVDLPFRQLKALRREFRQNRDFGEETVRRFSGAAVVVSGAIMPIDPVPENSRMTRFWVANTVIVMAGCVFCFPPTMGDLVYVDASRKPYKVDREQLYRSIVKVKAHGRLVLGPGRSPDGVEYMFGLELSKIED